MSIVPKRDYFVLLLGDLAVFVASLWLTLGIRYLSVPSAELFRLHIVPFAILFVVWCFVFFLFGLYDRHTRILRARLRETILYVQAFNIGLAALFFFFIPYFGIAPKTNLFIYLVISSLLIYVWRVRIFPHLEPLRRYEAIVVGSGPDIDELVQEINADSRYPFSIREVINTKELPLSEVVQRLCKIAATDDTVSVIVADTADPTMSAALPIMYDVAFRKEGFVFVDVRKLYQEVFERVPLSIVRYDWILAHLDRPFLYDALKRVIDVILGVVGSVVTIALYPLIALAIKIEDRGPVFVEQERVGQYQKPIRMRKFRSMSGSDTDKEALKSARTVTKVGKVLRKSHLDELPQSWNLLKGDLSFVGPRPELPALVAHYAARIPYYHARHLVKPGLTGWARIRHKADPHHGTDVAETKNKLAYDLYYLEHRSLLFDVYIIFQTVKLILTARGS